MTVFHELSHYLMKIMFHCKLMPSTCGPEVPGSLDGESGILLEEMLIGGTVSAIRKDSDFKKGEMDKIKELVLGNRGRYRKLSLWL